MSSLDYLDLCRLCLVKDRVSVPIFEGEGDVRQIFLKITACLPVKVDREDKLPKKICDDCVYKVELFYQFWNTTVNAEKQLLQWLGEVGLEEKPDYITNVLGQNDMKPDPNGGNRLDGSMMQQVSGHQNNMGMSMMDNIGLSMPMMMPTNNQQQMTSVPMDTSGSSVQNVQEMPGTSNQTTHEQITQSQTNTSNQQEEDEESSEEEENSEDECDGEEGLPVKEEGEEDPNSSRAIEPTTFVNVSLACDEAGPSGLQQQKIAEMPEMAMPQNTDGDPKSGKKCMRKQRQRRDIKQERTSDEEVHREDTFVIFRYINSSDSNPKAKSTLNNSTDSLGKKQDEKVVCERNNLDVKKGNEICKESKVENCKKDEVENCEKDDIENCKNNVLEVPKENELNDETESEAAISKENVDVDVLNKIRNICPFCEKEFSSELNVERHVISVHQKRFKCSVCTKSYSSRTKLGLHETVHKPDLFFECSICHVKYRSENTLQRHQVRVHEKDNIIYVCEHCGKNYKLKSDLSIHIKKTHPFELQICRYCGKEVKDITGHEYSHIRRARKKPCNFTCHLCPQKFCHRSRLDKHLSKHKNGFKCTYCELKFQGSKELKNHKHLKHSQSGSLICIFCQKVFACSSNFYQHVLTHAGIRPYKCDICEEDFTQRSSLLRHRRNHPGPLPQLAVQSPQVADLARSYIQKFQNGLIDKPSH